MERTNQFQPIKSSFRAESHLWLPSRTAKSNQYWNLAVNILIYEQRKSANPSPER